MKLPFPISAVPYSELRKFFSAPVKISTPAFSFRAIFRNVEDKPPLRFVIVTTKKDISNLAVVRNRARRRIREAIRISISDSNLLLMKDFPRDLAFFTLAPAVFMEWPILLGHVRDALLETENKRVELAEKIAMATHMTSQQQESNQTWTPDNGYLNDVKTTKAPVPITKEKNVVSFSR